MKRITLRKFDRFSSVQVLTAVIKDGGERGLGVGVLRKRIRVLDALERLPANADTLELEDADFDTLREAIALFQFALADRGFVTVLDDVEAALNSQRAAS